MKVFMTVLCRLALCYSSRSYLIRNWYGCNCSDFHARCDMV